MRNTPESPLARGPTPVADSLRPETQPQDRDSIGSCQLGSAAGGASKGRYDQVANATRNEPGLNHATIRAQPMDDSVFDL